MGRPTTPGDWLELSTSGGQTIRVLKAAHPRARRLRLTVSARGARVSCPVGTHPARVMAFVRDNVDWLERKIAEMRLDDAQLPPLRVGRPTDIPWRGQSVRLDWGEATYPRVEQRGGTLRLMIVMV